MMMKAVVCVCVCVLGRVIQKQTYTSRERGSDGREEEGRKDKKS